MIVYYKNNFDFIQKFHLLNSLYRGKIKNFQVAFTLYRKSFQQQFSGQTEVFPLETSALRDL